MTTPIFYSKVTPLSKEQHKNLFIDPIPGYAFAARTNSVYIAVAEFQRVAKEYPIVFGQDDEGTVFPVALLGLKTNENVFVDAAGEWDATYIPAYARRYPFILASPGGKNGQQFTVCIDESFAGFNTANEGQPLFDKEGKETEVLQRAIGFLRDFQEQVRLTESFCRSLVSLEILEPMQAQIALASGRRITVGGFLCVNRERLRALPAKKLTPLMKSSELELIFTHLFSLDNVRRLMPRPTEESPATPAAPAPQKTKKKKG